MLHPNDIANRAFRSDTLAQVAAATGMSHADILTQWEAWRLVRNWS